MLTDRRQKMGILKRDEASVRKEMKLEVKEDRGANNSGHQGRSFIYYLLGFRIFEENWFLEDYI